MRLNAEQTAWALNCQPHDIPVLVAAHVLKPLGTHSPNSEKYFSTQEVIEKSTDRSWLVKMTSTLYQYWQKRNVAKR